MKAPATQFVPYSQIDAPWKRILSQFFRPFVELCLPTFDKKIDWSKGYEKLDKDLEKIKHSSKTGKRLSDMLVKVRLLDGQEKLILIHLEIQAQKQNDFAHRMFIYSYRIYDQYQLPVVSVALLLDNDSTWRPNSFELKDPFTEKPYHQFYYHVIKLVDFFEKIEDLKKEKNIFSKVLRIQLAALKTEKNLFSQRLHDKVQLDTELLKSELNEEEISQLKVFLDWILQLPEELMINYQKQIKEIEEELGVTFVSSAERVGVMKGLKEGIQQGMQQGEASLLKRLLQRRFADCFTKKYLHLLEQADCNTLSQWAENLLDAKTIDDVFKETCAI